MHLCNSYKPLGWDSQGQGVREREEVARCDAKKSSESVRIQSEGNTADALFSRMLLQDAPMLLVALMAQLYVTLQHGN